MGFSKGDRVRYLGKPEWGPGLVLSDAGNGKIRVRFLDAGEKLLLVRYAKLLKVKPPIPDTHSQTLGRRPPQLLQ